MSNFKQVLEKHFPGSVLLTDYMESTYEKLTNHGFDDVNTFACVSTCRDEIAMPLLDETDRVWGEVFNFSSLGGPLTLGKTGFAAATSHAPVIDGLERYVFIAMPHIAISEDGEIGKVMREGRDKPSLACGALMAVVSELESGKVQFQMDLDDIEQSILKSKIFEKIEYGEKPDLMKVTKVTHEIMIDDFQRLIEVSDKEPFDYALLTGILVHGPNDKNYVWPGEFYAVHAKDKEKIKLSM